MTHRALRIRHYIGTITAACLLGGLLLAFELALLFQSLERRSVDLRQESSALSAVEALHRGVDDWLRDMRVALGDAALVEAVQQRMSALLLRLDDVTQELGPDAPRDDLADLRAKLQVVPEGAHFTLLAKPGSQVFEENRAQVVASLDTLEGLVRERFLRLESGLQGGLEDAQVDLGQRREQLWHTVGYSVAAYGLLVLALWRWVVLRLL